MVNIYSGTVFRNFIRHLAFQHLVTRLIQFCTRWGKRRRFSPSRHSKKLAFFFIILMMKDFKMREDLINFVQFFSHFLLVFLRFFGGLFAPEIKRLISRGWVLASLKKQGNISGYYGQKPPELRTRLDKPILRWGQHRYGIDQGEHSSITNQGEFLLHKWYQKGEFSRSIIHATIRTFPKA